MVINCTFILVYVWLYVKAAVIVNFFMLKVLTVSKLGLLVVMKYIFSIVEY